MNENYEHFFQYMLNWQGQLPVKPLDEISLDAKKTAIISVDLINGFCTEGPLSSPRVQSIVPAIQTLLVKSWEHGIRNIVLTQDSHEPDAIEFGSFAPHCIRGTHEAETVPELKALPFFNQITVIEKNSIHSGLNTGLSEWLKAHPQVDTFLVVGDCTDLCTYQLAMYLRLEANSRQLDWKVIVPADCVDTYDISVETAQNLGIIAHDGDFLHTVFLYHMALNGIEVVAHIE
jgi:nicotinamidase-related amidase